MSDTGSGSAWSLPGPVIARMLLLLLLAGMVVLIYAGLYRLNPSAVQKHLEPRRQELDKLLNELEPECRPSTMTP